MILLQASLVAHTLHLESWTLKSRMRLERGCLKSALKVMLCYPLCLFGAPFFWKSCRPCQVGHKGKLAAQALHLAGSKVQANMLAISYSSSCCCIFSWDPPCFAVGACFAGYHGLRAWHCHRLVVSNLCWELVAGGRHGA